MSRNQTLSRINYGTRLLETSFHSANNVIYELPKFNS